MSAREIIKNAYAEYLAEKEIAAQRHRQDQENTIKEYLSTTPLAAEMDNFKYSGRVFFTTDGLEFRASMSNNGMYISAWQLRGICPECSQPAWSIAYSKLIYLAPHFDSGNFTPDHNHVCETPCT